MAVPLSGALDPERIRATAVTGSDLIVAAPWIVFGAALGAICARLYVARSRARRRRAAQRPERRRLRGHPLPATGNVSPQPPGRTPHGRAGLPEASEAPAREVMK
jgi:hypothetical protein